MDDAAVTDLVKGEVKNITPGQSIARKQLLDIKEKLCMAGMLLHAKMHCMSAVLMQLYNPTVDVAFVAKS